MAKGNMFQGMARGKVGDIVFSRLNGEQISRVRNRNPRNPRTNAQLYQRAIMATVMQAYSQGKAIFDHSFEGFAKGAECQRRFMHLNSKALRELIASEIAAGTAAANCNAAVIGPGIKAATPNPYIISEGSLTNNIMYISDTNLRVRLPSGITMSSKISDYVAAKGLHENDIFTLVFFYARGGEPALFTFDAENHYANQYPTYFGYIRFRVKTTFTEEEDKTISDALFDDVFIVDSYVNARPESFTQEHLYEETGNLGDIVGADGHCGIAAAVIRSRSNEDLRSSETLQMCPAMEQTDIGDWDNTRFGIKSPYVLDAWSMGTNTLGNSDLILEGGGE